MGYYKISEFASLIGVSSTTLRSWETKGWLVPHHRSPSGYRFYSEGQLQHYLQSGHHVKTLSISSIEYKTLPGEKSSASPDSLGFTELSGYSYADRVLIRDSSDSTEEWLSFKEFITILPRLYQEFELSKQCSRIDDLLNLSYASLLRLSKGEERPPEEWNGYENAWYYFKAGVFLLYLV